MKSKESSSCQQVETKMAAGYFGKVLRHDKFVNYLGFGLEFISDSLDTGVHI
jgi:hypothetical protein